MDSPNRYHCGHSRVVYIGRFGTKPANTQATYKCLSCGWRMWLSEVPADTVYVRPETPTTADASEA